MESDIPAENNGHYNHSHGGRDNMMCAIGQCLFLNLCSLDELRLFTVTYGTAAAPYLALRVLNQLVE